MPDASRGVPVWRMRSDGAFWPSTLKRGVPHTHLAYPVALAEARKRVVEEIRPYLRAMHETGDIDEQTRSYDILTAELAALDALEGADTEGHDA